MADDEHADERAFRKRDRLGNEYGTGRPEKPVSLDEKRFGWQMAESVANLKLRCLELALEKNLPGSVVNQVEYDPIKEADRMARFVLGAMPVEVENKKSA